MERDGAAERQAEGDRAETLHREQVERSLAIRTVEHAGQVPVGTQECVASDQFADAREVGELHLVA